MRSVFTLLGAAVAVALSASTFVTAASAVPYTPGEILRVTFNESGPTSVLGGTITGAGGRLIDTLSFFESDNLGPPAHGVGKLYNGTTLLGTVNFTAQVLQLFSFGAPGDPFTFGPVGTVNDWSSFIDGTINGVLDLTFDRSFDVTIGVSDLGVGGGSNQIYNASVQPTILSQRIVAATPLPAAFPLFVTGLGLLGFAAGHRKRKPPLALAAA